MMNQVVIEETSFEEVLSEIEENGKYKRLPSKEKTWMTVTEMGNLLGLKKTGRYWLVQKNYFECREIAGQMRVNIASFEKWYANQVKYQKVNGEEPGKNLKKWSYSISEVAKMLGISETTVYDLIKRDGIKTVTVDYWIRIPKKSFQEWYEKQSKYRTQKDRRKDEELEDAGFVARSPDFEAAIGDIVENTYSFNHGVVLGVSTVGVNVLVYDDTREDYRVENWKWNDIDVLTDEDISKLPEVQLVNLDDIEEYPEDDD